MGTPKTTTRLAIPYPDENDDDWWGIEDGAAGRMETLDKALCAALERPTLHKDPLLSAGYWDYDRADSFDVMMGDVVVSSPSGGTITFADGQSVPVTDGDYVWFVVTAWPVDGAQTGTLVAGASFSPDTDVVVLGRVLGGKFAWLNDAMRG